MDHRTGHDLMNSQRLQYYIHDESDVLRFELAGSLSGAGLESVYRTWHKWLSIIGDRPLVIDITFVVDADEHGRAVLAAWHRSGARIIAASPESRALAQAVLGEPTPVARPRQTWLQRLRGFAVGGRCRISAHSVRLENGREIGRTAISFDRA